MFEDGQLRYGICTDFITTPYVGQKLTPFNERDANPMATALLIPILAQSGGQSRRICRAFVAGLLKHLAGLRAGVRCSALCLTLALLGVSSESRAEPQWQSLDALRQQIASFLESYYQDTDIARTQIQVNSLDSRLRLTNCSRPLTMDLNDPELRGGNISVHTRCKAPRPWAIYVPARVSVYRPLPVASRSLTRGHRITQADVVMEVRDTGELRQGLITQAETAIGQELRRPLAAGEAFRTGILVEPLAVTRGDHVRLQAGTGAIAVITRGTALDNGRLGEQIRVRNNQSARVIKALITGPGEVRVR